MRNDFCSNYLAHSGTKGMRWYIRRYQNPDGSLTEEGRRHYGIGPAREKGEKKEGLITTLKRKSAEKKKAKQRKAALEKARLAKQRKAEEKRQAEIREAEEKRKAEEFAREKERILRSGSPEEIMKYKDNFNNNEFQSALNRVRNENEIKSYIAASEKKGMEKINNFMSKADTVYNWTTVGLKWYNRTADIYNTFLADEGREWKKIGNK